LAGLAGTQGAASGALLPVTASLVPGSATGANAAAGTAAGTLIGISAALIPGAAAGVVVQPQQGATGGGWHHASWLMMAQPLDATAQGMVLEALAELLAGRAIAAAMAPGVLLASGAGLGAGLASTQSYTQAHAEELEMLEILAEWI
jgi:hypothetical protein